VLHHRHRVLRHQIRDLAAQGSAPLSCNRRRESFYLWKKTAAA
jgi:hypothetical protein